MNSEDRMDTYATKVPEGMAERIEKYREEHGLSKSQAIRNLIDEGYESVYGGIRLSFPSALLWLGSLILMESVIEIETLIADGIFFGTALVGLGLAASSRTVTRQYKKLQKRLQNGEA